MAAVGHRPLRAGHFTTLGVEATAYAQSWWLEEEDDRFTTGCPDYSMRPAMVYAIEAARLCCVGPTEMSRARDLLHLALEELS